MPDDKDMPKQDNDFGKQEKQSPDNSFVYEETTTRIRKSNDPSNDTDSWPTQKDSSSEA